jgi:hypothetical protein
MDFVGIARVDPFEELSPPACEQELWDLWFLFPIRW